MVNPKAAGNDVASMVHDVAVPSGLCSQPVRHLGAFPADLEGLVSVGSTTVARESTGNYGLSLYEVLEARGIQVCLVNARQMKHVSGRKTDGADGQWFQQLHSEGLLAACLIPDELTRQLRCYVRQRNVIEKEKARDLQHLQRRLTNMNLKLHHVISDIEGVAGLQIIEAMAAGETDAVALARFRSQAMQVTAPDLVECLRGSYRAAQVFSLQQSYRFHVGQMRAGEQQIEQLLATMAADAVGAGDLGPRSKSTKTRNNPYGFALSSYLQKLLGVDLTQVSGLGEATVLAVVSETGTD